MSGVVPSCRGASDVAPRPRRPSSLRRACRCSRRVRVRKGPVSVLMAVSIVEARSWCRVPGEERQDGLRHRVRLLGEQGMGCAINPHGGDPVAEIVA